jgi:hypothetical protein
MADTLTFLPVLRLKKKQVSLIGLYSNKPPTTEPTRTLNFCGPENKIVVSCQAFKAAVAFLVYFTV